MQNKVLGHSPRRIWPLTLSDPSVAHRTFYPGMMQGADRCDSSARGTHQKANSPDRQLK